MLLGYPSLGDFLAYQYITDLNYSKLTDFTEMEFVVAGPGALDGIRKCFADTAGLNPPEVIRFMADRQHAEIKRLGLTFRSLWGRTLQLIDCQNLFCEVSKYARQRHPNVKGVSDRTRIKQKFRPNGSPIALGIHRSGGSTENCPLVTLWARFARATDGPAFLPVRGGCDGRTAAP